MAHNPGFLNLVNDAKSRVKEIDIQAYKKMAASGDRHILIDTREESEYAAGHVKGAVPLSKGIIERDIADLKSPELDEFRILVNCTGVGARRLNKRHLSLCLVQSR